MEVARLAGVHQSTVSRVMNNPEMVHDETRRKVQQAISILNYRPWSQARSLATNRHETIGLITDELTPKMSSHHVDLVEGVVGALTEAQYSFAMANITRQPGEKTTSEHLMGLSIVQRHSCDGLIFNLESANQDILDTTGRLDIPCVWVNPAFRAPYDCVIPDDQGIAETAVNYLISRGHRRIAYLNSTSGHQLSIEQRQRGYEIAMLRARLDPMPLFDKTIEDRNIKDQPFEEAILERIHERLAFWLAGPTPPTAIIAHSCGIAIFVGRVAYRENWRIPEMFSLVSCDDGISLEDWGVSITAVSTNRHMCGRRAVEMLFQKLQTGESIPSIQIKGELIERQSVLSI